MGAALNFGVVGARAAADPTEENLRAFREFDELKHEDLAKIAKLGGIGLMGAAAFNGISSFFSGAGGAAEGAIVEESLVGPLTGTVEAAPVIGGVGAPEVAAIATGGGAFVPTTAGLLSGISFSDVLRGAGALVGLNTQRQVADAQVEQIRAQTAATNRAPVPAPSAGPMWQAFGSTPSQAGQQVGGGFMSGILPASGSSQFPVAIFAVIAAVIVALLFLKR